MARPRAPDHDAQRQRILSAAVQAFSQSGYANASMSRLAAACETSKATLYHYFPNKEALLFEALDRYTRKLLEIAERTLAAEPRGEPALRALVRALMLEYRHSRAVHVSLLQDVKYLGHAQAGQIREQERRIVDRFAEALDAVAPGAMAGPRRKPLVMAMLGSLNFTFAWLRPDGAMGPLEYADMVVDLWLDGLRREARAEPAETRPGWTEADGREYPWGQTKTRRG